MSLLSARAIDKHKSLHYALSNTTKVVIALSNNTERSLLSGITGNAITHIFSGKI